MGKLANALCPYQRGLLFMTRHFSDNRRHERYESEVMASWYQKISRKHTTFIAIPRLISSISLFADGFPNFQSSFPEWCEDERTNNMQSNSTEQLMGLRWGSRFFDDAITKSFAVTFSRMNGEKENRLRNSVASSLFNQMENCMRDEKCFHRLRGEGCPAFWPAFKAPWYDKAILAWAFPATNKKKDEKNFPPRLETVRNGNSVAMIYPTFSRFCAFVGKLRHCEIFCW